MANTDTPRGFQIHGPLLCLNPHTVLAGYATALYPDDMVIYNDGAIEIAAASSTTLVGANQTFSAASTATSGLMVADDPDQLFQVQDDGQGTPAQTVVAENADMLATAGNATTKTSQQELDGSTFNTTTALQFHILEAVRRDDNDVTADNCDWVVVMNETYRRAATTGV